MRFFTDIPEAFRHGILGASTTGKKVRRWAALIAFWLTAAGCAGMAVFAATFPDWRAYLYAALFSMWTLVFLGDSVVVIYNASADEYRQHTRRIFDEMCRR